MKNLDQKWYVLLVLAALMVLVGGISSVGASPADCSASSDLTGFLTQSGSTITGTANNCTEADADVGLVIYAAFMNDDGTIENRVHNRVTGTVAAGQMLDLTSDAPDCMIKAILYEGANENENKLAQSVYNIDKDNYCKDEKPTPTPKPPTETPTSKPPTETPTPKPPTKTPTPVPPTKTPTPPAGGEGCTPGYWRQDHHFDSWTNYSPDDSYDATFGVDGSFETLLDAVWARGGQENALARHAVAALLNAANPDVSYAYTEADVIVLVQSAYASGDFESVKNLFEAENELGCPLN